MTTTTALFAGGPGNKRDRARLAALNDADQRIASYTAEKLYDGARTVARCWNLALDALDALSDDVLADDWRP